MGSGGREIQQHDEFTCHQRCEVKEDSTEDAELIAMKLATYCGAPTFFPGAIHTHPPTPRPDSFGQHTYFTQFFQPKHFFSQ